MAKDDEKPKSLEEAQPFLLQAIQDAFAAQLKLFEDAENPADIKPDQAILVLAEGLTSAIHAYTTSASVSVAPGIEVSTEGDDTAQTGLTTSSGTGNLL